MSRIEPIAAANASTGQVATGKSPGAAGLPHFLMIGAMKAGTTTLYEYLCRHPDVYGCPNKEPGFFSRPEVYERGMDWYRSLFQGAAEHQQRFEASTCYSRAPHFADVPARIAQFMPDARLIYIMRHPVQRAYSHYGHLMRLKVTMTFEQALEAYGEIIDASMYMRQIEQYLAHFRREQMLFLTLDDLEKNPAAVLQRVQRFLDLRELPLNATAIQANQAGAPTAKVRISDRLRQFRRLPGVSLLADAMPSTWRQKVHRSLTQGLSKSLLGRKLASEHKARFSPMLPQTRMRLLNEFSEPNRALERFTEQSFPTWFT